MLTIKPITKTRLLGYKRNYKYYPKTRLELIELIIERILSKGNCCDLNDIDVSAITDMTNLFNANNALRSFDGDISKWDVSNVETMYNMFTNSKFDGDISMWDVSNVTNMVDMFYGSSFNGDISKWDVSNVKTMKYMFTYSKFNGDISKWNVGNVTDMCGMFQSATFFNGDLSKWDVSNVHIMADMFNGAIYFDNDLSGWNVDKVTNYDNMFNHSPLMTQLEKQPKFAHRKTEQKCSQ